MKIKGLSKWIGEMSNLAYITLKLGLVISCIVLIASLLLTLGGGMNLENYSNYLLAKELVSLPVSILLISIIGSACLEDLHSK